MASITVRHDQLLQFLEQELIATISLPINKDQWHAASLVFWNSVDPLTFYFVTGRNSEKFKLLGTSNSLPATCVVGTYNHAPATLQMRGVMTVIDPATVPGVVDSYHRKRGNEHDDIASPENALLAFTPDWARFTQYKPERRTDMLEL